MSGALVAVLAGGRSRRMGTPKALVPFAGVEIGKAVVRRTDWMLR